MPSSAPGPLVFITPDDLDPGRLVETVNESCRAGLAWVQLRRKHDDAKPLLDLAERLRVVTSTHGALLIVNDRVDVAAACEADGVHLPEAGMTARDARRILGAQALIGRSVHSIASLQAQPEADWIQFGAIFPTPSKAQFSPQGLGSLGDASAQATRLGMQICAVGGIDERNVEAAKQAGAHAVAVIRAIADAADPAQATIRLLAAWNDSKAAVAAVAPTPGLR